jgi:molybdopterin synthase sulfur carrier subunit
VTIELPGSLRDLNDGRPHVELEAAPSALPTVGDALAALRGIRPAVYDRLVTERGEVRTHVNLFVDGEEIRHTGRLATPLGEDARILVVPAVSGG